VSILALDLATKTGWAVKSDTGIITSGVCVFNSRRFEGGGMRYLRFSKWLEDTLQTLEKIDVIYFEEVRRHVATDAAHVYGGLVAVVTAFAEHHKIPYQGVPVGTIKKHVTGKGNASKEKVIEAVKALGHDPQDDNEADALALLDFVIRVGA